MWHTGSQDRYFVRKHLLGSPTIVRGPARRRKSNCKPQVKEACTDPVSECVATKRKLQINTQMTGEEEEAADPDADGHVCCRRR